MINFLVVNHTFTLSLYFEKHDSFIVAWNCQIRCELIFLITNRLSKTRTHDRGKNLTKTLIFNDEWLTPFRSESFFTSSLYLEKHNSFIVALKLSNMVRKYFFKMSYSPFAINHFVDTNLAVKAGFYKKVAWTRVWQG